MTFWLDVQLDPELAAWLGSRFKIIAKTTREIGLSDAEDEVVFHAGRRFGKIVIVSKDRDFVGLVQRHGPPPQVLWLHFPNLRTIRMQALLARTFADAVNSS